MKYFQLITAFFIFPVYFVFGETDPCVKSTKGTNFWFGFMEGRNYLTHHFVEILVTADETTNYTVTFGPGEIPLQPPSQVAPGAPVLIRIPWTKQKLEAVGSEKVESKGIHVTSEKPVSVYAMNWDPYSSDATVIYPVELLGNEYFAMCYEPGIDLSNPGSGSGRNSEFLIVATENNTIVEITPSKVTDKLVPKDSTFIVIINKGEVFQVQSENVEGSGKQGQGDLTGSHVKSDKPVAFFSGNLSTTIPEQSCCWDHVVEQIPPVDSWGKEFLTLPLKPRKADRFRILAAHDNTTYQLNGQPFQYLNKGEFHEITLNQNELKKIISDKPILVAQFSQSNRIDSVYAGGIGDPFMLILNPINQWINSGGFYSFISPAIEDTSYHGIKRQFVNIVVPQNENSVYLDGQLIQSQFKPFPGADYNYAQIEISSGEHRIVNTSPNGKLQAYIYGMGKWESYGYGLGFERKSEVDLGEDIEFFEKDTLLLCSGDTLELDAGASFDSYLWNNGSTQRKIKIWQEGWFWVAAQTTEGCKKSDTVFVKKSMPQPNLYANSDEICQPGSVKLDGGTGFEKYLWQKESGDTLSTDQIFFANTTGYYRLTVYNEYRCAARDTFRLTVFPVPEIKILGDQLVCDKTKTSLTATIKGNPENSWNVPGNYNWTANSADLLLTGSTRFSVQVEAKKWGDFEIYYHLKTIDGCDTTITFPITFHPQPANDFIIDKDPGCENYSAIVKFTGSATNTATFNWDLNGRVFLDTIDPVNRIFLVSVGAKLPVELPVSLVIDDNGCISEPVSKMLPASIPNLTMSADKSRGCDSMEVLFTGKMLSADPVKYTWTFNETQKLSGATVTKKFTGPQFVKVSLTVSNLSNRCINSFTIDSMIRIYPTPVAEIMVDQSVCNPDSVLLVCQNPVDSTWYSWSFADDPVNGFGMDSVRMKIIKPVEKVKLTINEFGCISLPDSVWVKRKPQFGISAENEEGCQPFSVKVLASSPDKNLEYTWILDTLPYPKGYSNVYFFADTGRYDITVVARSDETLCIDTLIKTDLIKVYKKPYAKFIPDHEIALLGNAAISFKNTSENAINYYWNFGDSVTSHETNPEHTYQSIGKYDARLISGSDFGCTDTFKLEIQIIPSEINAPNAFRPDSEIPENRTFMPVSVGVDLEAPFSLKIFNRWGEMIFESGSISIPWDGKLKSGNDAPGGNYVWTLNYTDIQGYKHSERGQVLLIR